MRKVGRARTRRKSESQDAFLDRDEAAKFSRDRTHEDVAGRDVQPVDLGSLSGEDGKLNLPRHLELVVYGCQLPR